MKIKGKKIKLLYTMTNGLGDYIVLGDLMRKAENRIPGLECTIIHRANPHIKLWEYDDRDNRFCNVYSMGEMAALIGGLKKARREGSVVFGLQMALGSLQGFFMYSVLKKLGAVDYIVDFNLINADIITPPKGEYILELHLNQLKDLLGADFGQDAYGLDLPVKMEELPPLTDKGPGVTVGLHPWSRRGHLPCFTWPYEKWADVVRYILGREGMKIKVFGKDKKFNAFKDYLKKEFGEPPALTFEYSHTVKDLIKTVSSLDLLVGVNTSVVHIGYALGRKMVILSGPSLNIWTPKGPEIRVVYDEEAAFKGSDKFIDDDAFPSASRIRQDKVLGAIKELLA